ncbi:hypothetical protein FB451DRAFT_1177586 [Mycena latifolia]|nr:hypothetical protein FB451DRAFT_1177586 [Mycena latifolia]
MRAPSFAHFPPSELPKPSQLTGMDSNVHGLLQSPLTPSCHLLHIQRRLLLSPAPSIRFSAQFPRWLFRINLDRRLCAPTSQECSGALKQMLQFLTPDPVSYLIHPAVYLHDFQLSSQDPKIDRASQLLNLGRLPFEIRLTSCSDPRHFQFKMNRRNHSRAWFKLPSSSSSPVFSMNASLNFDFKSNLIQALQVHHICELDPILISLSNSGHRYTCI